VDVNRDVPGSTGPQGSEPSPSIARPLKKLQREAELARLRACPPGIATTTTLLEPPLRLVDGPSFAVQYEDIFVRECYDFACNRPSPTILDGGANVGAATIWWLARWPKATIIAFEPDPRVFEALAWNTRFLEGAELHHCALGSGSPTAFWSEGTDAGRLITADEGARGSITVATITLSEVLSRFDRLDMLKLDIEGAETDVLEEAEDALQRVENIFVEYHSVAGRRQQLGQLLLLLQRHGFRYYLESPAQRMRPFRGVSVDRGIDAQCDIFAWHAADGGGPTSGPVVGSRPDQQRHEGSER
jgi:FkbM family methyltransferase